MKRRCLRALSPAIIALCILCGQGGHGVRMRTGIAGGPEPATKRALLVGIEDYPPAGPDERDLPGVHMDIKRMKELLVKDYGFDERNIVCVQDGDATKVRIESELTALAARSGPTDVVVFYYSGHGTLLPDVSGDEPGGWDQALVPAEQPLSRVDSDSDLDKFLIDDRVGELLRNFRTKNLTVIFDSCFSGDADRRGQGPPVSGLSFVKGLKITPGPQVIYEAEHVKRETARDKGDQLGRGYTFLAAAQPWETSACAAQGSYFTSALVSELSTNKGVSWNQLFTRVQSSVLSDNPTQTPTVFSGGSRVPFTLDELGDKGALYSRPSVAVDTVLGEEGVILGGYQSIYVEYVGALYDVYPATDAAFTGRPLGRLRINGDNDSGQAKADIVRGSFSEGARAVPVSVPLPPARPAVMLSAMHGADAERNRSLDAAVGALYNVLRRQPALRVYSPAHPAPGRTDYNVILFRDTDRDGARIWSGGGGLLEELPANDADSLAADLGRWLLTRHGEFLRLVRLHNPSPPFRLEADGQSLEDSAGAGRLRITVVSQTPCWVNVVSATERGRPDLVAASRGRVRAGEPFTFTVARPQEGKVVLKVHATETPLNLQALRGAPPARRVEMLYRLMRNSLTTGGGGPEFISTAKWADETLWLASARN